MAQLETAREQLLRSEERLMAFQQQHSVPEVALQAERTMEAAAQIQQLVVQQELLVSQLRRTATAENPQLQAAVAELDARRAQLRQLTSGDRRGNPVFLSLAESPELKVEATRLLRDYTRDEQVYIALTRRVRRSRHRCQQRHAGDGRSRRSQDPHRTDIAVTVLVALAGILGFIVGLAAAFGAEFAGRHHRAPNDSAFSLAWEQFKGDLAWLAPRRRKGRTEARTPL
jgi:hypothetical protein